MLKITFPVVAILATLTITQTAHAFGGPPVLVPSFWPQEGAFEKAHTKNKGVRLSTRGAKTTPIVGKDDARGR
ncbi:MAG: hypothetical protein AAFW87_09240 [Pseudomonadota bacterium]